MSSFGASPRTLADDLLITTSGPRKTGATQVQAVLDILHSPNLAGLLCMGWYPTADPSGPSS
eukprot:9680786-Karenia_brevis.AAC.1